MEVVVVVPEDRTADRFSEEPSLQTFRAGTLESGAIGGCHCGIGP